MYRALSDAELQTFVDELWLYRFWREHGSSCARFALAVYGPHASSVEITIGSFYTDEYYGSLPVRFTVRDALGSALVPDLATPWWRAQGATGEHDLAQPRMRAVIEAAEGDLWRDLERTGLPFAPTLVVPLREPRAHLSDGVHPRASRPGRGYGSSRRAAPGRLPLAH